VIATAGAWLISRPFTAAEPSVALNPHGLPSLGPGPAASAIAVSPKQDFAAASNFDPPAPVAVAPPPRTAPSAAAPLISHPAGSAPLPPSRPIELGLSAAPPAPFSRPALAFSARGDTTGPSSRYDHWTAVYDLAAHTVYLPNGVRLEAHSGLGDRLDDPAHVSERNRGATPPHLYELKARDELFHGVQALRLDPIGGGDIFGRAGFLAHTYMLGPNGDSNGCVSFKDYQAFLRAFQNGQVKRLAVVARID
jgi:hypothetical protein